VAMIERRTPKRTSSGAAGDANDDGYRLAMMRMGLKSQQENAKAATASTGPSLAPATSDMSYAAASSAAASSYAVANDTGPSLASASSFGGGGNGNAVKPGAFGVATQQRNAKELVDQGPSLAPAQSNVIVQQQQLPPPSPMPAAVTPFTTSSAFQDRSQELEVETGIPVGAFAIAGLEGRNNNAYSDSDSDIDENNNDTANAGNGDDEFEVDTGIPTVDVTLDAHLATERDPELAQEEEVEVVAADGVIVVDDEDEYSPKAMKRLRTLQGVVVCLAVSAVALIIGAALGFQGNSSPRSSAAPPEWIQVGGENGDIYGPKEEQQVLFGQAVAISGNGHRLAVAAPGSDQELLRNVGQVWVLDEIPGITVNDTEWQVSSVITGQEPSIEAKSAITMSKSGNRLAVGRPMISDGGSVEIYDAIDQNWTSTGTLSMSDSMTQPSSPWFGYSVDMTPDGSTVVIGAPLKDSATAERSGLVRVYQNDGGAWAQLGSDIEGTGVNEFLGWAVAIVNNPSGSFRVVAGGPAHQAETGIVRVFDLSGTTWQPVGDALIGDLPLNRFGEAVSMSSDGTVLAVGARGTAFEPGEAKVFRQTSSNEWVADASTNLVGQEPAGGFGSSVKLNHDGSILAVGSPQGGPLDSGRVRMLQYDETARDWSDIGPAIGASPQYHSSQSPHSAFGSDIALNSDGSRVLVGAPSATFDGSIAQAGMVRVYDRVTNEEDEADEAGE